MTFYATFNILLPITFIINAIVLIFIVEKECERKKERERGEEGE